MTEGEGVENVGDRDKAEAHEQREAHVVETVDVIASRLRNWTTALVLAGTVVGGLTAASVRWVTGDVRRDLAVTRSELQNYTRAQHERADADSVRFERAMGIVELAVIALVEPNGSEEQRRAVADLRARRHYVVTQH